MTAWIKRFDGQNQMQIQMQAQRGVVLAVVWTAKKHRLVKTKKAGRELMMVWKKWYERQGWKVLPLAGGFAARHPDGERRHAVGLHVYDIETLARK